jgi:hypothetical protein
VCSLHFTPGTWILQPQKDTQGEGNEIGGAGWAIWGRQVRKLLFITAFVFSLTLK